MIDVLDETIVQRIQRLSGEQHRLYQVASARELTAEERQRLQAIKAELPELWLARKRERVRFRDPLDDLVEQWYRKSGRTGTGRKVPVRRSPAAGPLPTVALSDAGREDDE